MYWPLLDFSYRILVGTYHTRYWKQLPIFLEFKSWWFSKSTLVHTIFIKFFHKNMIISKTAFLTPHFYWCNQLHLLRSLSYLSFVLYLLLLGGLKGALFTRSAVQISIFGVLSAHSATNCIITAFLTPKKFIKYHSNTTINPPGISFL